jgi:hypothetical protein
MNFRPEVADVRNPDDSNRRAGGNHAGRDPACYGESDTPMPEFICRAAYEAPMAGHTGYTRTPGSRDSAKPRRKAFELQGVECRASQVVGTSVPPLR